MKILQRSILLFFVLLVCLACGSDKGPTPEPKEQQYFVKTIERTFPVNGEIRRTNMTYDQRNRISELEFVINNVRFENAFTYNAQDLIVRVDQNVFMSGTVRAYGLIMEFRYTEDKLSAYIEDAVSTPVTYNPTDNSYAYGGKSFYWDANNNLKRIQVGSRTRLETNYLSHAGVFKIQPVQMALAIFNDNISRTISLSYSAAMDNYVFSKNELSNLNDNEVRMNYFTSIRDDKNNIIQVDVKNEANELIRRYVYTYELRNVE